MQKNKEVLKEQFIKKAIQKFGKKFDYSKVNYIDCKTLVTIICPDHGEFIITPERHLLLKNGCPQCNRRKQSKNEEMTFEEFLEKANLKYNNKYIYKCDNWEGLVKSKVILICPEHGEYKINPRSHLFNITKCGCPKCGNILRAKSKTENYENVIQDLKQIYNDYYIYPDENKLIYKNKSTKIKIICPEHGEYYKSVIKHLSGQYCHKCKLEHLIKTNQLPGGYCEDLFNDKPELKNKKAILYYLSINNGKIFKIGISIHNTAKNRINALIAKAKSFGIQLNIKELYIKEYSLYEAFKIEQKILHDFNNIRIYTKWSTELFKENIEEYIIDYFK